MTCREELLHVTRSLAGRTGRQVFRLSELLLAMFQAGSRYSESTIRTHVVSRCCRNAPENHAVTYDDFERVGRGLYRLVSVKA